MLLLLLMRGAAAAAAVGLPLLPHGLQSSALR
jgi:hypothetical protein